jgi:hypothetical protein
MLCLMAQASSALQVSKGEERGRRSHAHRTSEQSSDGPDGPFEVHHGEGARGIYIIRGHEEGRHVVISQSSFGKYIDAQALVWKQAKRRTTRGAKFCRASLYLSRHLICRQGIE